jgi:hypothetical protein
MLDITFLTVATLTIITAPNGGKTDYRPTLHAFKQQH